MACNTLQQQWNDLYREWRERHQAMLDAFPAVSGWVTRARLEEWNRRRAAVDEVRRRMNAVLGQL
jgi:hypothetical protein